MQRHYKHGTTQGHYMDNTGTTERQYKQSDKINTKDNTGTTKRQDKHKGNTGDNRDNINTGTIRGQYKHKDNTGTK